MVKTTSIVWYSPASFGDSLALVLEVPRWGNTSFDVSVVGSVGERHVFDAKVTYVVVDTTSHRPVPVPAELRNHFDA